MMALRFFPALLAAGALAALPASAQLRDNQEKSLACRDNDGGNRHRVCSLTEQTLNASPRLEVNASPNGGITVKGWLKSQVLVRARIEAWGDSDSEAAETMKQVRVLTAGGRVSAEGPKSGMFGNQKWSVSFEVFVPQRTDLDLNTTNGGINISDVRGAITFDTTNGGVNLARLAGRVKGETTNGGVNVELEGSRWDGESLDVETTNGGVNLTVPDNYSGRFAAKTTNGGISTDFPGGKHEKGFLNRSFEMTTGGGGALIRVETTNGGVKIRKPGAASPKRRERSA